MESRSKDKKEKDECTPTRKERYNISHLMPILVSGFGIMFHFVIFSSLVPTNWKSIFVYVVNMFGLCLQEAELAEKWGSQLALGLVIWDIIPLHGSYGTLALVRCKNSVTVLGIKPKA